jgi:hypothetical protein
MSSPFGIGLIAIICRRSKLKEMDYFHHNYQSTTTMSVAKQLPPHPHHHHPNASFPNIDSPHTIEKIPSYHDRMTMMVAIKLLLSCKKGWELLLPDPVCWQ